MKKGAEQGGGRILQRPVWNVNKPKKRKPAAHWHVGGPKTQNIFLLLLYTIFVLFFLMIKYLIFTVIKQNIFAQQ
jgi:hypothetical protein